MHQALTVKWRRGWLMVVQQEGAAANVRGRLHVRRSTQMVLSLVDRWKPSARRRLGLKSAGVGEKPNLINLVEIMGNFQSHRKIQKSSKENSTIMASRPQVARQSGGFRHLGLYQPAPSRQSVGCGNAIQPIPPVATVSTGTIIAAGPRGEAIPTEVSNGNVPKVKP